MRPLSLLFVFVSAVASGSTRPPCLSRRPAVVPRPAHPRLPVPQPPKRSRVCEVQTHGDGQTDDSTLILEALHACNNGGHVLFGRDATFVVGTALDLTFLQHVDIDIQGRILFSNDTDYWQANSFRFGFQNVTSFFKLGGKDVFLYGGGTLDGNGQAWYDLYAADIYTLRPVLVGIDGLHDSVIADLQLRYSPMYYSFVANASNVVFDHISIAGASTSKHVAKNTDGWDTYRSRDVTIMNSVIDNGDDCVSFKPNSTDMLVQSLVCTGSHGISVGSLSQYPGTLDIVEHIHVANVSLHNATNGARIKVWPNAPTVLADDLQGGGGSGRVNNVTYTDIDVANVDDAIEITQCYGQKNLMLCVSFPSALTISNVRFRRFTGTTSATYAPEIAAFACSSTAVCGNISAVDIAVTSPQGSRQAYCLNQDTTTLDVDCTDVWKGFN
ncbi:exopolygalacturonase [Grosmannia clavigera kw1407]|uniref:galacturonan 1,4-alpha-galacturonidase n=1 Tax=Grosmannia clavigera (strain kw1407 / UAMH 11150) TaxID=655863 RepID=F0XMP8_GROCL|nr:exopolygalacturonase [Grosmannia clavigera kw1407]EFX01186.1 exopolygalacturonase [Grosmannia clavigera kw1407]